MEIPNNKSSLEARDSLKAQIVGLKAADFDDVTLKVFQYQSALNPVYKQYLSHLDIRPEQVTKPADIPFFPIQFFKYHTIQTGQQSTPKTIFQSSGTTGQATSSHPLFDDVLYQTVSRQIFIENYGDLRDFHIFALLPSYLERNNSSLVYMMQHFINESHSRHSGFYLHNTSELLHTLRHLHRNPDGKRILLLGVTFALLDLAEGEEDLTFLGEMPQLTVMDTGGMKGRRKELLREEVHDILVRHFRVAHIHSEYGMTELLSQGYSKGDGLFKPGFTMRILLRDIYDPRSYIDRSDRISKTGGINVIDLANLDSCAFIETQDLGRYGEDENTFYVMGRFDNADVRGCNLMVL